MKKIDGKSGNKIIFVAVCCVLVILAGAFVAKKIFFIGLKKSVNLIDNSQAIDTDNITSTEPENKKKADNVFAFKVAKVGDRYGDIIVSKVTRNTIGGGKETILYFDNEVGISGTYRSEFDDITGDYITLILDEESRKKVPVESILIEQNGQKNANVLDKFGKTGTTGSFNLIISGITVTNQIYDYYICKANIEKINEIKKDEISKWVTDEMVKFSRINSVAFDGKNKYVTVGTDGIIKTSSDLINWNDSKSPAIYHLFDVIWAKGKFITVEGIKKDLANIYVSDDGEKWTKVYSGDSFNMGSFACDGNTIVYVSGTTGTVITSTDGLNWVERRVDILEDVQQIFYDGKRFIAYSYEKVFASPDGLNWSLLTDYNGFGIKLLDGEYFNIVEIIWNGKEYVGICDSNIPDAEFIVITSKDGVTWENRICDARFSPYKMAWNGYRYVATGLLINDFEGLVIMMTSVNGKDWEQVSVNGLKEILFNDIIWDGSQFVAVGYRNSPIIENNQHAAVVFKSRDGVNWVQTYK